MGRGGGGLLGNARAGRASGLGSISWRLLAVKGGTPAVLTPALALACIFMIMTSGPWKQHSQRPAPYLSPQHSTASGSCWEQCATAPVASPAISPIAFAWPASTPLRVYMYELPRKFNLGLVELFHRARASDPDPPGFEFTYPGHQHSGEWWLYLDLLSSATPPPHWAASMEAGWQPKPTPQWRRPFWCMGTSSPPCAQAGVRVFDAEEADVFFVPVFSSLSLIVYPLDLVRQKKLAPAAYDDLSMQVELMDWLEQQQPWIRSGGRDHVFPAQDPNSMRAVWDRMARSVLLVSDFGRLSAQQASLSKDVVVPYVHRVSKYWENDRDGSWHTWPEKEQQLLLQQQQGQQQALGQEQQQQEQQQQLQQPGDVPNNNRSTLLFFMGARHRKDAGVVRDVLFRVLQHEPDMVIKEGVQSLLGRRESRFGMRTSQFCLHPAGDTPSACRLFDAILNLCVPVVVSDAIELPFEDVLDYSQFALFVSEEDAVKPGYLRELLLSDQVQQRLPTMQQRLREVRHLFEWEVGGGTVPQVWRKVASKLPAIQETLHRQSRLVHSAHSNASNCHGAALACAQPAPHRDATGTGGLEAAEASPGSNSSSDGSGSNRGSGASSSSSSSSTTTTTVDSNGAVTAGGISSRLVDTAAVDDSSMGGNSRTTVDGSRSSIDIRSDNRSQESGASSGSSSELT